MSRFFAATCLVLSAVSLQAVAEPRRVEEAAAIPDIVQTDRKLGLAGIGRSYCGPAAVANAVAWLITWRRPGEPAPDHGDLVRRLASADYMGTDPDEGTGARGLARGVRRALDDLGINGAELAYRGWRSHPQSAHTGDATAGPDDLAAAGSNGALGWINVGWYTKEMDLDGRVTYTRTGGHWVTVVTAGLDARGEPAPDVVALHDPAPRSGLEPRTQFVTLEPLEPGTLEGPDRHLPRPADGHVRLGDGMVVKKGADLAVADGLLVLRLPGS